MKKRYKLQTKTPITVITGPLGSGKTTLLRHLLAGVDRKLAIVMNEFGEIAIDSKIVEGKNVRMTELGGGCVCCSLIGEFEAAVNEIIDTVDPEEIVLETTGVAEPGTLLFNIQESLPRVRLDGVISVIDADGLLRFPSLGHTSRLQIEEADLILLNKVDLVNAGDLEPLQAKLRLLNPKAPILLTTRCRIDLDLLFGLGRERQMQPPEHRHQPEFQSVSFAFSGAIDRACFEEFARSLGEEIYRAKGFVSFADGNYLFNFVRGQWELEPFAREGNELVFIGRGIAPRKEEIANQLKQCLAT